VCWQSTLQHATRDFRFYLCNKEFKFCRAASYTISSNALQVASSFAHCDNMGGKPSIKKLNIFTFPTNVQLLLPAAQSRRSKLKKIVWSSQRSTHIKARKLGDLLLKHIDTRVF